jgi:uncharacterized protein
MNLAPADRTRALAWAVLLVPFFLNDLANIWVADYAAWTALDYLSRGLPLAGAAWLLRSGRLGRADLGLAPAPAPVLLAHALAQCLFAALMIRFGDAAIAWLLPKMALGGYPEPARGSALFYFDLYLGLFIVAVSEEVVFRGLALTVLRPLFQGRALPAFAASALLFALAHWSGGPRQMLSALVFGLAFAATPWRTGSILPVVAAHYLADLMDFW